MCDIETLFEASFAAEDNNTHITRLLICLQKILELDAHSFHRVQTYHRRSPSKETELSSIMVSRRAGITSVPVQRRQPNPFIAAFRNMFSPFVGPRTPVLTLKSQRLSLIYTSILHMTYTTVVPAHLCGVVHDPKVDALLSRLDPEFDLCYTDAETGSDDASSELTLVDEDEDILMQDAEGESVSGKQDSSPITAPSRPSPRKRSRDTRRRLDDGQPRTMLLRKWQMANGGQLRRIANIGNPQKSSTAGQYTEQPIHHLPRSIVIADCSYPVPQTDQQRIQLTEAVFGQVLAAGEIDDEDMGIEPSDETDAEFFDGLVDDDDGVDTVTDTVSGRGLAPAVASYRDSLKVSYEAWF